MSIQPVSSISSFEVSSPVPLTTAVPAMAGSEGGSTTVTPVRWPLCACECPTRTPGTSVIAFRSPVGRWPTGPAMSRQRSGTRLCGCGFAGMRRIMKEAGGLVPLGPRWEERRVHRVARLEAPGTARVEAAALRHIGRVGELAGQELAPPAAAGLKRRGSRLPARACTGAAGSRSRPPRCRARRSARGTSRRFDRRASRRG